MAAFTVALIAMGIGAAWNAYQQHKKGKAEQKAAGLAAGAKESEAQLQDVNAGTADLQAADAITRGAEAESRYRTQVRGAVGRQRAGFAASNVDVGFGSPVDVQADAAFLGELDALTIRTNAAREAWGYRVQADDLRRRAAITRKEGVYLEAGGKEAARQGNAAAVGTLIGGGASLLQARYGFNRAEAE